MSRERLLTLSPARDDMCLDSSSSSYIRLWVIDIEEADFCDYVTEPFALFPLAADLREFCYAPDFIF